MLEYNRTMSEEDLKLRHEQMVIRWAVLASWYADLSRREVLLPENIEKQLTTARSRLASGMAGPEVQSWLDALEATLTAADATTLRQGSEDWIGLLGQTRSVALQVDHLLHVAEVRANFVCCYVPCRRGP